MIHLATAGGSATLLAATPQNFNEWVVLIAPLATVLAGTLTALFLWLHIRDTEGRKDPVRADVKAYTDEIRKQTQAQNASFLQVISRFDDLNASLEEVVVLLHRRANQKAD